MKRTFAAALALVLGATAFFSAHPALADDERVSGVSTVQLDVEPSGVDAVVEVPLVALERAVGTTVPEVVTSYLQDHLHVAYSSDGRAWASAISRLSWGESDGLPSLVARMHFARPEELHENALELTDDVVVERDPRHRIVVFVRRDFEMAKLDDASPQLAGVLHASRKTLTMLRADASWTRGMRALFVSGVDRLVVGPGLLFLWLLLLTAPLVAMHGRWSGVRTTRGATRALMIAAAAFVSGHALSFVLAAEGWLRPPLASLELLVGLTLTLVAFHTVRPFARLSSTWISGFAGCVHGLAFAATLADLGPFTSLASLVTFTIGIEGLQLVLVGLVSPSLVFLRDARVYGLLRTGAAAAAAFAALVTVAPEPVVLLVALAATAVAAAAWLAASALAPRMFHAVSAR